MTSEMKADALVRVDSTRPDCLKVGQLSGYGDQLIVQAMIIGPQGTPYENGCFVFDIHLPHSYNTVAPNVSSMTTNGGKYRYNPNLYADGVSPDGHDIEHKLIITESLPKPAWNMGGTRMDIWEVHLTPGLDLDPVIDLVRRAISQRTRLVITRRSEWRLQNVVSWADRSE